MNKDIDVWEIVKDGILDASFSEESELVEDISDEINKYILSEENALGLEVKLNELIRVLKLNYFILGIKFNSSTDHIRMDKKWSR